MQAFTAAGHRGNANQHTISKLPRRYHPGPDPISANPSSLCLIIWSAIPQLGIHCRCQTGNGDRSAANRLSMRLWTHLYCYSCMMQSQIPARASPSNSSSHFCTALLIRSASEQTAVPAIVPSSHPHLFSSISNVPHSRMLAIQLSTSVDMTRVIQQNLLMVHHAQLISSSPFRTVALMVLSVHLLKYRIKDQCSHRHCWQMNPKNKQLRCQQGRLCSNACTDMVWRALSNRFHQGQVDLVRHTLLLYMHDLCNVMLRLLLACWLLARSHVLGMCVHKCPRWSKRPKGFCTSVCNPNAGSMLLAITHTLHWY